MKPFVFIRKQNARTLWQYIEAEILLIRVCEFIHLKAFRGQGMVKPGHIACEERIFLIQGIVFWAYQKGIPHAFSLDAVLPKSKHNFEV